LGPAPQGQSTPSLEGKEELSLVLEYGSRDKGFGDKGNQNGKKESNKTT